MFNNRLIILWITVIFCFCSAYSTGAAEYPWEKDARMQKQKNSHKSRTEKASGQNFQLGPFTVKRLSGWQYLNHPDQGEMLLLVDEKTGEPVTFIALRDTLKTSNRKALEQQIIKKLSHQHKTRVELAGRKDVLAMRDISDGQTTFFFFPYTEDMVYVLAVCYRGEQRKPSGDVWNLMKTFTFTKR